MTRLDPMNPRHRAALIAATLLGVLVGGLITEVLFPAIIAAQIGGAA